MSYSSAVKMPFASIDGTCHTYRCTCSPQCNSGVEHEVGLVVLSVYKHGIEKLPHESICVKRRLAWARRSLPGVQAYHDDMDSVIAQHCLLGLGKVPGIWAGD